MYGRVVALDPERQMQFFKAVTGKGIKAMRSQYKVFWTAENASETISQEEEQFEPLGYWEAKGYSRAQILQDATDADVRHNVPMKGTCYRVLQQTKKKIFASRLYKREELGASGSVKKAGGLMKAARKSLKADKAALLAEQKLERVEKAEEALPEEDAESSAADGDSDDSEDGADSSDDSSSLGDLSKPAAAAKAKKKAAAKKAKKERKARDKAAKKARKLAAKEKERQKREAAAAREKAAAKKREDRKAAQEKKAADAAKASLAKYSLAVLPKLELAVQNLSALKCDASASTGHACCISR